MTSSFLYLLPPVFLCRTNQPAFPDDAGTHAGVSRVFACGMPLPRHRAAIRQTIRSTEQSVFPSRDPQNMFPEYTDRLPSLQDVSMHSDPLRPRHLIPFSHNPAAAPALLLRFPKNDQMSYIPLCHRSCGLRFAPVGPDAEVHWTSWALCARTSQQQHYVMLSSVFCLCCMHNHQLSTLIFMQNGNKNR